jgi:hypothetical protein
MVIAETADVAVPEGIDIPEELKLRRARPSAIAEAKTKLEQRAVERHAAKPRVKPSRRNAKLRERQGKTDRIRNLIDPEHRQEFLVTDLFDGMGIMRRRIHVRRCFKEGA